MRSRGADEVIRVLRSYSTFVIEHNRHVALLAWCTASFVVKTSSLIYDNHEMMNFESAEIELF